MILSKPCAPCRGLGWRQHAADSFPVLCHACTGHGTVETDASVVLANALGCTLHTATRILKGTWRGQGRYPSAYALNILGRLASLAEHEPLFLEGFI
jgi:hypothetical protein